MKELNELSFPEDIRYAKSHEWIKIAGETAKIGITDYAQDQLGEIVFVELPEEGDSFSQGDEFGSVESVKAVSEIYLPISGEIVAINEDLEDAPELVNNDPYQGGWIMKIKTDSKEKDKGPDHDHKTFS